MEKFDFDRVWDRRGTNTYKYDKLQDNFGRSDLLPMWVADMDFAVPECITEALNERMKHPIFGYSPEPAGYRESIVRWIGDIQKWNIREEWLSYIPGIVKGIGMVINMLLDKGDKVVIQPPVYHPFRNVPTMSGFEVVDNPLIEKDGTYEMDFEQLENVLDDRCKLLILSNPHNPAGVMWSRDTLVRLAEICHRHGMIVISDEIHCDMPLWGRCHIPFASVSPEAEECSITFGAPSKTFNIAGIVSSYAIVPNDKLREKFFNKLEACELGSPHVFAPIATMAAYTCGNEWRKAMLKYIEGNIEFVEDYCRREMPAIHPWRPEASFLIWLDCRGLGLTHDELIDLFVNKARLAMNDGAMFGQGGSGFMRMNIGTSRTIIKKALDILRDNIKKI